ncbi:helix-turn-helix domain-containing protein [Microvirga sp. CF3016]|nr:helix-turn-helix domain-containing protein [Microvirga sp. CF3016]MEE1609719.1 helix-turn-helix domain-containing protein [Microvirga sp. CF3016]
MSKAQRSPSDVDRYIGCQIRLRRMAVGMSQEKLGESIGITFQQVQKYERGMNRVGAARLQSIAHVLGLSIDCFYPNSGTQPQPSENMKTLFKVADDEDATKLLEAFASIKKKGLKKNILELVERISRL